MKYIGRTSLIAALFLQVAHAGDKLFRTAEKHLQRDAAVEVTQDGGLENAQAQIPGSAGWFTFPAYYNSDNEERLGFCYLSKAGVQLGQQLRALYSRHKPVRASTFYALAAQEVNDELTMGQYLFQIQSGPSSRLCVLPSNAEGDNSVVLRSCSDKSRNWLFICGRKDTEEIIQLQWVGDGQHSGKCMHLGPEVDENNVAVTHFGSGEHLCEEFTGPIVSACQSTTNGVNRTSLQAAIPSFKQWRCSGSLINIGHAQQLHRGFAHLGPSLQ